MNRIIEEERGTYTPRSVHSHNGYYAGDFSSVPFKQPDLRTLLVLDSHRDTWQHAGSGSGRAVAMPVAR